METVKIPKSEYLQMIGLLDSLKSKLNLYNSQEDTPSLPVVWAKNPDLTALFSIADENSKLDLSEIRKTWKRKN
jgi:uncharacterized Rmd1/YagE family protein